MMDYYQTLGINKDASQEEIKQAYRKLASVHHPDKGGDTAKFQEIQQAYETLSDPNKKQEYDMPQHHGFGGFGGFPGGFSFNHSGINIDDIFGQMFGHPFANRQQQYPTYKTVITVTLEQVYNGGEQILQFQTHSGNQIIRIDIPKGVENGQQLRYDKLVPNTILLVEFRIQEHPKFQRRGLDLYSEVSISVLDLIVGTSIEFEVISGKKFNVVVPPKTQPNTNLRIQGQGLTNRFSTGDQFLLLKPFIPDIIDASVTAAILQSQ